MKKLSILLVVLSTILVSCQKEVIENPTKELRYEVSGENFDVFYLNEVSELVSDTNITTFSKLIIVKNGFSSNITVVPNQCNIQLKVFVNDVLIHEKTGNLPYTYKKIIE